MRKIVLLVAVLTFALSGWAQSDAKPEILILGVYHMSNPGRDIYNMKADDVLSPQRQQEIAQLLEVLKKFQPTKIALEADAGSERIPKDYTDYLAGKYTLTRNERDQIGFRLAKELGHKQIYGVDEEGEFPWGRVVNYAKANGRLQQFDASTAKMGEMVKQQDDFLHSHTVLETLVYMNADEKVRADVGFYYGDVTYSDPDDYAGADLIAKWFQRNIRIYSNIVHLVDSPNERILVIYGAGHLGWLQQNVSNDPSVKLRKLSDFTGKQ
ncbi:MAG TPA: DUF5694 domain-containing protein [Terriglobales bacterium]|nr:DUF5694 domain-containing protein [Terriglobales bacterium]